MPRDPYVNYDAIEAMSDEQLQRALANDSMPFGQFVAMQMERAARKHHDEVERGFSFSERWPEYCIGLGALLFALWLLFVSTWA